MTAELVGWLLVQLDDDERKARDAPGAGGCWRLDSKSKVLTVDGDEDAFAGHGYTLGAAEHIARWDPARVLAEVDAKRRIIAACEQAIKSQGIYGEDGQEQLADDVLRQIAVPYADRSGYRQEWRPAG